ncbi:class I SAM-dependent methyltransferase [Pseudoalteromonas sp. SSMSWG5]|jgi:SAM-dependent methyltransferase|uniref:class I SAM-dependent methyltransferase n=1 Tax=Pseudoalteromonas TaxID=53246 RepID=UPI000EC0B0E5|nr:MULTISPECIES: class I SAM-dependent methyltransferase [unclassified Pseudoalteromonas]HCV04201.1 SAM-dependent methyltransferase [Pseudoalteromonas sp.]MCF2920482.1 class I SAM-dependent methyltransferase [Pseudoalteromonas sp. APAL1]MCO7250616.1 class I SAM-dependent methyltransferase [Pseudoalteromonas sp. Ps84H-4]TGV20206.1 SAM-dependent methyltransferase [Pseudoalteromonas sp. MEBiC 03607]TMO44267.1 SAM-dependent methyltransferase [Pseudoalteromonas sp. S4389]|tara:strand:- start:2523 stop:3281 length:759 start_codon:yes stop_codon:yes gene_type:complete
MKPALSFQEGPKPYSWQQFPHGDYLRAEIERKLTPWLPRMFGYHMLKLGNLSGELATSESPIKHQVCVAEQGLFTGVIADVDELPFYEHSVDACILSHCLEYHSDPHHILREAHRTLIPGGYIVITGFNPFSLCGLAQLLPFSRQKLPWTGRFFTPSRVKDWLNLLGFEIISDERFIHSSLARGNRLSRFAAWRSFGQQYLKPMGSVYMLVARKRVAPLTPIKPKWHARPQFSPVKGAGLRQTSKQHCERDS